MLAIKLIAEGLGLGFMLYLIPRRRPLRDHGPDSEIDHGNRGHGAYCRHPIRDHGPDSEIRRV